MGKKKPLTSGDRRAEPAVAEVGDISGIFNNCFYFNKEAGGKSLPWAVVTRSGFHEASGFAWLMVPEAGGNVGYLPCSGWAAIPWATLGLHPRAPESESYRVLEGGNSPQQVQWARTVLTA